MKTDVQAPKPSILVGVYHKKQLGLTERYHDLKEANAAGREWELQGYQILIRTGVSKLPPVYPFAD
jgi:hypothetical protein